MSWRLWNRETFCCCPQTKRSSRSSVSGSATRDAQLRRRVSTNVRIPELATSIDTVDSVEDDIIEESECESPPPEHVVRPELTRLDSIDNRNQKHISPVELENLVVSMKQTRELPMEELTLPTLSTSTDLFRKEVPETPEVRLPQSEGATDTSDDNKEAKTNTVANANLSADLTENGSPEHTTLDAQNIESSTSTVASGSACATSPDDASASDTSSTTMSTHDVVRGFVPGGAPSSYRSQTHLPVHSQPTPILKNSPRAMPTSNNKKKGAMFTLGASSGEEESSLESHLYRSSISSLSEGLHKKAERKQASFRENNLVSKIQDSPVFESEDEDDEDDEVSDGVIEEDEDSSDWEDELGEEDRSDDEEGPIFHKVESRVDLTSRRSLLTSMMHEGDRARALQNAASRSSPALRRSQTSPSQPSSRAHSPARERNGPGVQGSGIAARPIAMAPASSTLPAHLALSPRTTRRNMLSSELTESLRKNLLWERQHKSSQNIAALKRRHTSHDIKNLRQHPEPQPHMSTKENAAKFNNEYFHAGLGEYHSKGW